MIRNSWLVQCAASLSLLGALATAPASAAIVVNGGFETGSFSGWTETGNTGFSSVSLDAPVPQSGTYGASFGPFGTKGGISQTLATVAGTTYILDFWLQAEPGASGDVTPNSFEAKWNAATVTSLSNSPAFNYTHLTFNVAATSASTVLEFAFRDDPAFWDLDNVSVTAVPEPETWALIGLGLAVLAARRRRQSVRH